MKNVHFSATNAATPQMDMGFLPIEETDDWATPQAVFDELHKEFNFTLDPCSNGENAKCPRFFTVTQDGLQQSWEGERVFCNPPYGRVIGDWVAKCRGGGGEPMCCIAPSAYRHRVVSRSHIRESRNTIYPRQAQVRGRKELGTVSQHDSDLAIVEYG